MAVGMDARLVGVLILVDRLRAGTEALLRDLKSLGLARIVLATGDRRDVAEMVARALPIDAVRWELSPDQKTLVVLSERKNGPVMMIGDGINDVDAAKAVGIPMLLLESGYGEIAASQLGGDRLLAGFGDIPEALAELP